MLHIMTDKKLKQIMKREYDAGVRQGTSDTVQTIKRALEAPEGKIITQPQTIIGTGAIIHDCVMLGCDPYGISVQTEVGING